MKRHIAVIAAGLALMLVWTGCGKKADATKSKDGTSTGAGAGTKDASVPMRTGPVNMKINWVVGNRVVESLDVRQTNEIIIPGMPTRQKTEVNLGHECAITVLADRPDGGHDMEMEFLTTHVQLVTAGREQVNFDSTMESVDDTSNPMASTFRKLLGSKLDYSIDSSNQVLKFDGYADLFKKLTNGAKADAIAAANQVFSENYFKQLMEVGSHAPDHSVNPGETVPFHIDVPLGPLGKGALDYNVFFKGWEMHDKRQVARLEFDGTIKVDGKGAKLGGGNATLEGIEDGKSTGVSWFDPQRGMLQESDINITMTMLLSVNMGGNARRNPRAPNMPSGSVTLTNLFSQFVVVKLEDGGTAAK